MEHYLYFATETVTELKYWNGTAMGFGYISKG
jgi:hypothetical protein